MFSSIKLGNKYEQKSMFTPSNMNNKSNANIFLFFAAILPQKGIPPLNKSQIKAKVRLIAKTLIVENTCELPPPLLEIKIIGLYILLLDTNIVMDKKQLEKPKNIMAFLKKLETSGTLGNMLVLTFGQWHFYSPVNTLQLLYLI
jgi:hypothetical protein